MSEASCSGDPNHTVLAGGIVNPRLSLRSYGNDRGVHNHDWNQVMWCLRGTMMLEMSSGRARLESNGAITIPAGYIHEYWAKDENQFVVLDFDGEFEFLETGVFETSLSIAHLLQFFILSSNTSVVSGSMQRLLAPLLLAPLVSVPHGQEPIVPLQLSNALQFIQENFDKVASAEDLAAHLGVGRRHLDGLFIRWKGMTVSRYLSEIRLNYAKELLRSNHAIGIAEIAIASGYSEQSSLTRAFRRRFGYTPWQYRQRA